MNELLEEYHITQIAKLAGIPTGLPEPAAVVATIINILLSLVGVIAVIMIIYGGFLWMSSLGNDQKILHAKRVLTSAAMGLLIIITSYSLVSFVLSAISYAAGS